MSSPAPIEAPVPKKPKLDGHRDSGNTTAPAPTTTRPITAPLTNAPCAPTMVPAPSSLNSDLFYPEDQPLNKKGFRYVHCWVNPMLGSNSYSLVEVEPFGPRLSYEDRSSAIYISKDCTACSSDEGYRSARANVGINNGDWYFEVEILAANESDTDSRHVRVGLTRREASLEAPVGHDAYGYGLRDILGEKVHLSRRKSFLEESFKTGDVIGFYVSIPAPPPSQSPSAESDAGQPSSSPGVTRDRIPIKYKGKLLFEILDYVPIKDMDELILPTNLFKKQQQVYEPAKIEGSFIKVYKNGKAMGTAFEDLIDFRFPHSKLPPQIAKASESSADNGMLGYYPTISSFRGGRAKFNFGPQFKASPEGLELGPDGVRPLYERYDEQIAEDVVYDIVDSVVEHTLSSAASA